MPSDTPGEAQHKLELPPGGDGPEESEKES